MKELLARVRALLRRHERNAAVPETFTLGMANIDFKKQIVSRDDRELPHPDKETGMLRLLFMHRDETVSRDRFLDVV